MSCLIFAPFLNDVTTPAEQTVWLQQWTSNVLNGSCLNSSCGPVCLKPNALMSSACQTCLKNAGCVSTLQCLNCVGNNLNDFNTVFDCTFLPAWPWWQIFVVVLGTLFGLLLLFVLIVIVLYETNRLSMRNRLWVDSLSKREHELTVEQLIQLEEENHAEKNSMHKIKLRSMQI